MSTQRSRILRADVEVCDVVSCVTGFRMNSVVGDSGATDDDSLAVLIFDCRSAEDAENTVETMGQDVATAEPEPTFDDDGTSVFTTTRLTHTPRVHNAAVESCVVES